MNLDSSDNEITAEDLELSISSEAADANYCLAGELVHEDLPAHDLSKLQDKYPQAFTYGSETDLASVLQDLYLPFNLSVPNTSCKFPPQWTGFYCGSSHGSGKTLPIRPDPQQTK